MSSPTPPYAPAQPPPPNQRDPFSVSPLEEQLERVIDERIRQAWRTTSGHDLAGVPDARLCMELIARGWVVYKPRHPENPAT